MRVKYFTEEQQQSLQKFKTLYYKLVNDSEAPETLKTLVKATMGWVVVLVEHALYYDCPISEILRCRLR